MKYSLGISNFLEEIPCVSHSVVFLYLFALIAEEGIMIMMIWLLLTKSSLSLPTKNHYHHHWHWAWRCDLLQPISCGERDAGRNLLCANMVAFSLLPWKEYALFSSWSKKDERHLKKNWLLPAGCNQTHPNTDYITWVSINMQKHKWKISIMLYSWVLGLFIWQQ